jgi:hypothetical protein
MFLMRCLNALCLVDGFLYVGEVVNDARCHADDLNAPLPR